MMSGCGILTNGKGTRREYGAYNLDELQVGNIIDINNGNGNTLIFLGECFGWFVCQFKISTVSTIAKEWLLR